MATSACIHVYLREREREIDRVGERVYAGYYNVTNGRSLPIKLKFSNVHRLQEGNKKLRKLKKSSRRRSWSRNAMRSGIVVRQRWRENRRLGNRKRWLKKLLKKKRCILQNFKNYFFTLQKLLGYMYMYNTSIV